MVAFTKFWTNVNFCLWKFSHVQKWPKQSRGTTRRLSPFLRTWIHCITYIRTFGEAAVGETVVCMLEPGNYHGKKCRCCWERRKTHWPFTTKGITRPCSFSEIGGAIHDWKTVDMTAQRWRTTHAIYHFTPVQFFVVLIIFWYCRAVFFVVYNFRDFQLELWN